MTSISTPCGMISVSSFSFSVLICIIFSKSQRKRDKNAKERRAAERRYNDVILVIDIGSSSIRCTPFKKSSTDDKEIILLQKSAQKIPFKLSGCTDDRLSSNCEELNPAIRVLNVVDRAVEKCIYSLRNLYEIDRIHGIGISSFAMNIVGIDDNLSPITPLFTYATVGVKSNPFDIERKATYRYQTEVQKEIQKEAVTKAQDHFAVTGTVLNHQSYAVTQLRSFITEKPSISARVTQWTTLSSLFLSRWTIPNPLLVPSLSDRLCSVSYSEASWMGLLNFTTKKWDLSAVSLSLVNPTTLPNLSDFDSFPSRAASPKILLSYPELEKTRFFGGVGDGAAATVGSLCDDRRRVSVTIGTSAAVRLELGL
jgi:sugar (pentulose or hexulose) kinase